MPGPTHPLNRLRLSLGAQLTLAYAVLLLLVSTALSVTLYQQLQSEHRHILRDQVANTLLFARPQVDPDFHASIRQPEDEHTSSYNLVYLRLRTIQNTISAIHRIYTLRPDAAGRLVYVVDAEDDPQRHASVGSLYSRQGLLQGVEWSSRNPLTDPTWHTDPQGHSVWSGYTPLYDRAGRFDGLLGVDIDASGVIASQREALLRAIGVFFLTAPLALLAGSLMVRALTAPVFDLIQGARRVGQGQLDQPVPVRRADELGELARTFNTMQTGLSESRLQLEEYARTLEQRVAESTLELRQANAEIQALNLRLAADNLRLETELDVARRLQEMLLPTQPELEQIDGLEIAGFMQPADEVGGDYYDVLSHAGRVMIAMGDVTGHGLESGVVMLMLQTALRTLALSNLDNPVQLMDTLNRTLHANLRRMGVNKDLSLVLLEYQDQTLRLYGQHEQVIVIRRNGQVEIYDTLNLGFPIGLVESIGEFIHQAELRLEPGDGVVLYSDGLTEAEDEAGQFYGLERLCAQVAAHWSEPCQAIQQAVIADVRRFTGQHKVEDDLALMVIKQREMAAGVKAGQARQPGQARQAGQTGQVGLADQGDQAGQVDFGNFIEAEAGLEQLALHFWPGSPGVKARWREHAAGSAGPRAQELQVDFLADYWAAFFPSSQRPTPARMAEVKGAIAYIANELLENIIKFSARPELHPATLKLCLAPDEFRFYTRNAIDPQAAPGFQARIHELLTGDPSALYLAQVERNVRGENANRSQLGLLTMIHDYAAELAWRFEEQGGVLWLTSLVRLKIQ